MGPRPVIFVSAVSAELRSARKLVADTLAHLGYEAKLQDIAPTETGDLRRVLRKWVDDCNAVVQIVGHRYGYEPPAHDEQFGRCSYTQYEALYARQQDKPVWYLILSPEHPTENSTPEPPELVELQRLYRERVQSTGHLYHPSASLDQTEKIILRLRDDLAQLRRGWKLWAAMVLTLLAGVYGGITALIKGQQKQEQQIAQVAGQNEKILQALAELPQTLAQQKNIGEKEDEDAAQARAYTVLEKKFNLPPGTLTIELPGLVEQLLARADTSAIDRANALFFQKNFGAAEKAALEAKDRALASAGQAIHDAIIALELAGLSAQNQVHYTEAVKHFREAVALTSRERDAQQWARVRWGLGFALREDGQFHEAEALLREVLPVYVQSQGAAHRATLRIRNDLVAIQLSLGKFSTAEQDLRLLIPLQEKTLGAENPDTLGSRHNLANALRAQQKYAGAESEHRSVLAMRQRTLGPEHPDTLMSRNNLANVLQDQGRNAEAEREHRAVLGIRERVLGPDHPDCLMSRNNLANALDRQGKKNEAEKEHRAVLAMRERVLGQNHPDVLLSCYNLALLLHDQARIEEARAFAERAVSGMKNTLGADHPYHQLAVRLSERLKRIKAP